MTAIDLKAKMPGHVDIPRLRKGKVGGFFWCVSLAYSTVDVCRGLMMAFHRSAYVSCPAFESKDFLGATWRVR